MASVYDLKPRIQALLRPTVDRLAERGVTPNQLTYVALGLSALVGALISALPALAPGNNRLLLLLPAALLVRIALDAMDGMLAREPGVGTPRGAMLNELGVVLSDALLYLPLALYPGVMAWLVVTLVVLGICAEVAGLAALGIGASRRDQGPMGKNDRAIVFGLIGLILALDPKAAAWLPWLLVPAVVMAGVTIVNRVQAALREVAR